jgi:hypothetical protein
MSDPVSYPEGCFVIVCKRAWGNPAQAPEGCEHVLCPRCDKYMVVSRQTLYELPKLPARLVCRQCYRELCHGKPKMAPRPTEGPAWLTRPAV